MDTTQSTSSGPEYSVAGLFLESLAAGNFDQLAAVFDDHASLSALLPAGLRRCQGASEIASVFEGWFGRAEEYELVDASLGRVGPRLQIRWQVRLRAPRPGAPPLVVEQFAFADTGPPGRMQRMSLLCSGFCPEGG